MYSHILLFGATGQLKPLLFVVVHADWVPGAVGSLFARHALQKGYKLTVYVRNPDKLHPEIASHKNVIFIKGDLSDKTTLLEAVRTGVDSVVLLVGGDTSTKGTVCPTAPGYLEDMLKHVSSPSSMESRICTRF